MATYESFFPNVLPEVPGAAEMVVENAVRNSCIEFCEKSLILTRDHDPITVLAGIVDYDLDPPTGYKVIKVQRAWLDSDELSPLAPDLVREAATYNRLFSSYQSAPTTPSHFLQKDEATISVWPVPDKKYTNGLTLRVALKPSRASTTIEDVIFENYAETIASGALYRLMASPGKTYTNPELAVAHKSLFEQGINTARARMIHGHVRSNLQVKLRRI